MNLIKEKLIKLILPQHSVEEIFFASLFLSFSIPISIYRGIYNGYEIILFIVSVFILFQTLKMVFFKKNVEKIGYLKVVQLTGLVFILYISFYYFFNKILLISNFNYFDVVIVIYFTIIFFRTLFASILFFDSFEGKGSVFPSINFWQELPNAVYLKKNIFLLLILTVVGLYLFKLNFDNVFIALGESFLFCVFILEFFSFTNKKSI